MSAAAYASNLICARSTPEARRNLVRTARAAAKRLASMHTAAIVNGAMKTALGSCGSGFETAWNGLSNEPGRKSDNSRKRTNDAIAPDAMFLQRDEGSLPSGKTNAIAVNAANTVGHAAWSKSTAHSARGSDPGRSSSPYTA
jgi:hypothetical protein